MRISLKATLISVLALVTFELALSLLSPFGGSSKVLACEGLFRTDFKKLAKSHGIQGEIVEIDFRLPIQGKRNPPLKQRRGTIKLFGSKNRDQRYPEKVFSPRTLEDQKYGLRLMEAVLREGLEGVGRILVMGAGTGYEAVALTRYTDAKIDAVDIKMEAVNLTRMNAETHGVSSQINAFKSDLFSALEGEVYDLVLFNAPRPIFESRLRTNFQRRGRPRAVVEDAVRRALWEIKQRPAEFDPNGELLSRMLRNLPQHLKVGGRFYLMSELHLGHVPHRYQKVVVSTDPWILTKFSGRNRFIKDPGLGSEFFGIHRLTRLY
jgi:protein-L-isoaspartate O-methyltransferase